MQTQTRQTLPRAIKNQEDLLYFTHPWGVNNSLEPRKGGGNWGRCVGRCAVWLWAVHLRISACHCAQWSWGRFMTSLAEHHKTCQGISRPEIGYYVWFACFILPQPFSPFLEFLLLILLAFYLLPFYCLSWTLHLVEMRHKSKVYCEVELDLCPTTNLVHRAYMSSNFVWQTL